ncbi:MAG: PEP-CTERM sorting domain-containing protein [Candidatus Korobacteraceae bacterium]
MMRKLVVLAVLLCGAVYAYGQINSAPVPFTFIGWNDGNWQNGYPYYVQAGTNSTEIDVMCDDYFHGGMPGDQWFANITDLGTGNLSLVRFNNIIGPNSLYDLMLYDEAGWLLLETEVEPSSQWVYMNSAVWTIFDPSAPCDSTCQAWMSAAQRSIVGLPQSFYNDVYIITPSGNNPPDCGQHNQDPNCIQEFMYIGGNSSGSGQDQTTPEPGTLVLMGTGVLTLFGRKFLN